MIAHTGVFVSDYEKSKELYEAMLKPIGYHVSYEMEDACGFMADGNTDFWIMQREKPAASHVAFQVKGQNDVQAFYDDALAAGAKDNGKPGYRDYSPGYYAAFVHDFDGNNIEAVWYDPEKEADATS